MKRIAIILMTGMLFTTHVLAAEKLARYADVESIPQVLREGLRNGNVYEEQYIGGILSMLQSQQLGEAGLSQQYLDDQKAQSLKQSRRNVLREILQYDDDLDGQVTADEIKKNASVGTWANRTSPETQQAVEKMAKELMVRYDSDGNDIITLKEMGNYTPKEYNQYNNSSRFQQLLSLDPNNDGLLTIAELRELSRKAFQTIDTNGNGIIENEETVIFQERRNIRQAPVRSVVIAPGESCKAPRLQSKEQLAFVVAENGKSLSSVTVAGQDTETKVVPVKIGDNFTSLYLVLLSGKPVIWQLQGDTAHVSRVLIYAPAAPVDKKVMAGVTGVEAEKVSFLSASECLSGIGNTNLRGTKEMVLALSVLVGKEADVAGSQNTVLTVQVSKDGVTFDDVEARKARAIKPQGFDTDMWNDAISVNDGGVIMLDKDKVVSDASAANYHVLPGWVGMSKLIYEGKVSRLPSGSREIFITSDGTIAFVQGGSVGDNKVTFGSKHFRIIKDIPNIPAGLENDMGISFDLARGVKIPQGKVNSSRLKRDPQDVADEKAAQKRAEDEKQFAANLRTAQNGQTAEQVSVARSYLAGNGVQQSYEEAYFWASLSSASDAKQHADEAARHLTPKAIEAINARIRKWWVDAANNGQQGAAFTLGQRYAGVGASPAFPVDCTESFFWFFIAGAGQPKQEKCAHAGFTPDQRSAMRKRIMEWRPSCTPSPSCINDSLLSKADQGAPWDQFQIGQSGVLGGADMFLTEKDRVGFLERAAKQGYADGAFAYGYRYMMGEGVPIDYEKAYFWLNLGVRLGLESTTYGEKFFDSLNSKLTPEQRKKLDQKIVEWIPVPEKHDGVSGQKRSNDSEQKFVSVTDQLRTLETEKQQQKINRWIAQSKAVSETQNDTPVPQAVNASEQAVTSVVRQVKSFEAAVTSFRDIFGGFPGDITSPGKRLVGCTGPDGSNCNPPPHSSGDNIVGNPAFARTLKPQVVGRTNVPAVSAEDETVLFWTHLYFANLVSGVTEAGIQGDSLVAVGKTYPAAETGGGFIVGYGDGKPLPESIAPGNKGIAGTIIVLLSTEALQGSELSEPGIQALSPHDAAIIDRKMDDGKPNTGFVQAYGAHRCFDSKHGYAEAVTTKECGLIFRIQG